MKKQQNLKNKSGKKYEDDVAIVLENQSINFVSQGFLGQTLFGKRMKPDFMFEWEGHIITIECKNQVTRGSAEEKIFYTAHSIINLHSQFDNIIPFLIMSGGGWSVECIKFMKQWEKDQPIFITTINGLVKQYESGFSDWFTTKQGYKKRYE